MKVCFIGSGSIGTRHIKNMFYVCKKNNISLQADLLRSTDTPLSQEISELIDNIFYRYEDMPSDYDAIFIANPTYKHYETLINTLSHSSCFFIEKPVFEHSKKDISFLPKAGKKYYVACPLRYTSVLLEASKLIQSERVISARAISSSYLPQWRKNIDYRQTYSAHREQGGGVRIDIIHEWDYLLHLFGLPEQVFSLSGKFSPLQIDSEDIAIYIAQYSDKLVELHLDYFGRKTQRLLELFTADNEYVFDICNATISCNGRLIKSFNETVNDKYIREMEYFLQIVKDNAVSPNDIWTALDTIKIADS